jgi:UDP-glucose 4-epimerase
MEYLVIGGAGFIGSHLVERLVQLGKQVRVVDNFVTGKRSNLAPVLGKIDLIEGDLADPEVCAHACRAVRIVLHHAALPSVPNSVTDPLPSHRCNLDATFNLLIAARAAGVKRFVFAASSSAYGESPTLPKIETMPSSPLSPYAVQKLAGEHCDVFALLRPLTLRYFNVRRASGPDEPVLRGDSRVQTEFSEINLPWCTATASKHEISRTSKTSFRQIPCSRGSKTNGEIVNTACGEHVSVNKIILYINQLLCKNVAELRRFSARRHQDLGRHRPGQ